MCEKKAVPEIPEETAGCQGCADLYQLLAEARLRLIRDRQATRILTTTPMGITQTTGVSLDIEHYNKLIDDLNQANALLFETRKMCDELLKQLAEQKDCVSALTAELAELRATDHTLQTEHTADAEAERAKYQALEKENADLKAQVARLSAPVSDEEYECMFIAMQAVNKGPGKPVRGMEVFNAVIASRTTPAKETPCPECGGVEKVQAGDMTIHECDRCYHCWDATTPAKP